MAGFRIYFSGPVHGTGWHVWWERNQGGLRCDAGIQEHGCAIYTEMGPQDGKLGRENEDYFDDPNFMDERNEIEIG